MTLLYIITATLIGGTLSVIAAFITIRLLDRIVHRMVSYSAGVLLAVAFLDLLPEAFESAAGAQAISLTILAGLLAFFVLEKFALWRHSHHHEHDGHDHEHGFDAREAGQSGLLILVGDSLHNFADGILIAAAFLADVKLGIATAAAVVIHEIPQEAGDFIVLINAGVSRARALTYNILSSLAAVIGGVLGYFLLDGAQGALPYVIALAASSFIYIAVADLIPWMQRRADTESTVWQIVTVAAGVATIALAHPLAH